MTLTKEEFKALRDKGLSVEQIVAFESGKTPEDLTAPVMQSDTNAVQAGHFETSDEVKARLGAIGKRRASKYIAKARSNAAKGVDVLAHVLGGPASAMTKKVYAPVAKAMLGAPTQEELITGSDRLTSINKLNALMGSDQLAYPGDVGDIVNPVQTIEGIPVGPPGLGITTRMFLRLSEDTAGDPLTYATFGTKTALGKLVQTVHEAVQAGESIKLSSPLSAQIAKVMKAAKPSARVIRDFLKKFPAPARTMSESVSRGETSLISAELPFTNKSIPLVTGKIPGYLLKPASWLRRGVVGSKIEQGLREIFSTTTGNKDFDVLHQKYKDLVHYEVTKQAKEGVDLNQQLEDIMKLTGKTREEVESEVRNLGEAIKPKYQQFKETVDVKVRPKGKRVYHGTLATFDAHEIKPSEAGAHGPGIYVAEKPDVASKYASDISGGTIFGSEDKPEFPPDAKVFPYVIKPEAKFLEADKYVGKSLAEKFDKLIPRVGGLSPDGSPNLADLLRPGFRGQLLAKVRNRDFVHYLSDYLDAISRRLNLIDEVHDLARIDKSDFGEMVSSRPFYNFYSQVFEQFPELIPKKVSDVLIGSDNPIIDFPDIGYEEFKDFVDEVKSRAGILYVSDDFYKSSEAFQNIMKKAGIDGYSVVGRQDGPVKVIYNKDVLQPLFNQKALRKTITKTIGKPVYQKETSDLIASHYNDKMVDAKVALVNAQKKGAKPEVIDALSKRVATYNGLINELKGHYTPPPPVNPAIEKVVREQRAKSIAQQFEEQTSGVQSTPILSNREYIHHAIQPDALEAKINKLKSEGKIPGKLTQKEFNDNLTANLRREFNEVRPEVIDAWEASGLINKREARAIRSESDHLVKVVTDAKGLKSKVRVTAGLDRLDELLRKGRLTEVQYTNAIHTLSVDEVNALSKAGKLKDTFGDYRGDIFHTDPVFYSTIRGIKGVKAKTAAEFFNELKVRKIALPDADAPASYVTTRLDELAGHKVQPEVARVLNKYNEFHTQPQALDEVLKHYDQFHSLMKAWTLGIFPAYHTKNMVGNFWNNWLSGLDNPDMYRQALWVRKGKSVTFKDIYGNSWDSAKLRLEAEKQGVIGRGQFAQEPNQMLEDMLHEKKWRAALKDPKKYVTLMHDNNFLRAGLKVGKEIEDNARLAHFIDRLRKGDTAEQAALSVKKFLFDYGDLSDIEKKFMNRGLFFYTWTRNNIPLQLYSLVTTPGKFNVPFRIKHELEKEVKSAKEKFLPEYIKENFGIRYRYNEKTKDYEYFLLGNWLPAADLVKLAHLHEVAAQMIAPVFKEALQQLFNWDYFTKKKIQSIPGEQGTLFGHPLPIRLVHGLKIIRLLNEIDKMTSKDSDAYSKLVSFTMGKNYSFNEQKGKLANKAIVDQDIEDLKKAMMKQMRQKPMNKKEIDRIREMIREKGKEY